MRGRSFFALYSFYGSFETLADASEEDFFDCLSPDPELYIPVKLCPEGESARAIGGVVVSRFGTLGEEMRYDARTIQYGAPLCMPERIGTWEKAQAAAERYGVKNVSHATVLSAENPYSAFDNTLLLLQADGVWYVYDFEDSLSDAETAEKMYTLTEYIALRAELEKNMEPDPWETALKTAFTVLAAVGVWIAVNAVGSIVCLIVLARKEKKQTRKG